MASGHPFPFAQGKPHPLSFHSLPLKTFTSTTHYFVMTLDRDHVKNSFLKSFSLNFLFWVQLMIWEKNGNTPKYVNSGYFGFPIEIFFDTTSFFYSKLDYVIPFCRKTDFIAFFCIDTFLLYKKRLIEYVGVGNSLNK
jgi:hypothetical protein